MKKLFLSIVFGSICLLSFYSCDDPISEIENSIDLKQAPTTGEGEDEKAGPGG